MITYENLSILSVLLNHFNVDKLWVSKHASLSCLYAIQSLLLCKMSINFARYFSNCVWFNVTDGLKEETAID